MLIVLAKAKVGAAAIGDLDFQVVEAIKYHADDGAPLM